MRRVTLAAVVSAVALSMVAVVLVAKQDVHCDLFYDGVWNDVTAAEEVFTRDPFAISRGRADEVATAVPDAGTFTLDNREGKYNPRNPVGELYGKFGENTPARVHIGTPHVGAAVAESVAATSHVAPSVNSPTNKAVLIGVWANPDPANAYTVPGSMTAGAGTTDARTTMKSAYQTITSAGATGTRTATVGTAEEYAAASVLLHGSAPAVASSGGFSTVLNTDSGVPGDWWVVASYFGWDDVEATATPDFPSDTDGGGWILLADSGTDTWSDAQADFARMKVWAKRVKTTGTHTVKIDNPTGDLDSIQSVFYRVTGVTGWFPRLHGEAGSFKPGREIKGPAWVNVGAFGPSMRLTQGEPPKRSALYRTIAAENPVAYWPLEGIEDATVTRASSGLAADAMTGGPLEFGAVVNVVGSEPLPDMLGTDGTLVGPVTMSATGAWSVEAVVSSTVDTSLLEWSIVEWTAGGGKWLLSRTDTNLLLSRDGTLVDFVIYADPADLNGVHHLQVTAVQNGADLDYRIVVDGVEKIAGTLVTTNVGAVSSVKLDARTANPNDIGGLGHVAVYGFVHNPAVVVAALTGHTGEKAGRRFLRLCREENLTAAVVGDPDDTQPMGPQLPDTVPAQFTEIETTDDALIGDAREFLGLRMRTGRSMAAQQPVLELDYDQFHIAPPLAPVIDDQGARNDITVKRRSGGEAHAVQETGPRNVQNPIDDPQGVGRYRHTVNVNTATDGVLDNHAAWHRHKGTVDEIRWPQVTVDLLAKPELADPVSAADQGDLITIDNLPDDYQAHQARLLVAGYAETIHTHQRFVTFNCVPAATRDAGVYGPATTVRRYDSANSILDTGVDADDTTLLVATEAGHALWITSAAFPTHFPFDVRCAGIRLTVTAITSTSSPQTFTVLRNVDGIEKALDAGEQISLFQPAYYGL